MVDKNLMHMPDILQDMTILHHEKDKTFER